MWRANGQRYLVPTGGGGDRGTAADARVAVFFVDDNFTVDVERATELCRRMAELRLHKRFAIQNRWMWATPGVAALAAAAGCFLVFVGIESVHEESLRQIRKAANLRVGVARYAEMVRRIQAHGMAVSAGMIFGTDAETPESQTALERFVRQAHIDSPVYTILTPTPGTIWERLEGEGRLRVGPLPRATAAWTLTTLLSSRHLCLPATWRRPTGRRCCAPPHRRPLSAAPGARWCALTTGWRRCATTSGRART